MKTVLFSEVEKPFAWACCVSDVKHQCDRCYEKILPGSYIGYNTAWTVCIQCASKYVESGRYIAKSIEAYKKHIRIKKLEKIKESI